MVRTMRLKACCVYTLSLATTSVDSNKIAHVKSDYNRNYNYNFMMPCFQKKNINNRQLLMNIMSVCHNMQ